MASGAKRKPTRRRTYHHGDLRAGLLQAAIATLEQEGLAGLSLRAVARAAGVSHAAPAHHFGDVKGLFTALAIDGFATLAQECTRAGQRAGLRAMCMAYVDMASAAPARFELMFRNERVNFRGSEFAAAGARAYAVLQDGVARARRQAEAPADGDASAALLLWSTVHGYAVLAAGDRVRIVDPDRKPSAARALFSLVLDRAVAAALD